MGERLKEASGFFHKGIAAATTRSERFRAAGQRRHDAVQGELGQSSAKILRSEVELDFGIAAVRIALCGDWCSCWRVECRRLDRRRRAPGCFRKRVK